MSASPWAVLGIAPTGDQGAIRRAYSAKLKAIDVDAEPDRFIALREALNVARYLVAQAGQRDAEAAMAAAEAEPAVEAVPVAEPVPAESGQRPQWIEDVEALQALVFGEKSREEIFEEVKLRADRIFAAPEMESIDHAAHVERWAADVILSGIPRPNGLLAPAINQFGWLRYAGQWDCLPLIAAVLNRYQDCQFLSHIEDNRTREYFALLVLKDSSRMPRKHQAELVGAFLNLVRHHYPTVMQEVSEEAVAAWDTFLAAWHNRPAARFDRKVASIRARSAELFERWMIADALRFIGLGIAALVSIVLVIATYGIALFWIWPFWANRKV